MNLTPFPGPATWRRVRDQDVDQLPSIFLKEFPENNGARFTCFQPPLPVIQTRVSEPVTAI